MSLAIHLQPAKYHVVVWDPEGEFWDGSLVDGQRAHRLAERGVCVMPVNPDLFRMSSVGGYSKRSWGAGVGMDKLVPELVCPLTVYVNPEVRGLYWKARLVRDVTQTRWKQAEGVLRFVPDSGQRTPTKAAYTDLTPPVMVRNLGPEDAHGGWTIGGHGVVSPQSEGHCGFGMYGMAPGLRIIWVAATMAEAR